MSANKPSLSLPSDFQDRCRETNGRMKAGEEMTPAQIADALGLPFEFFAAAVAVYGALMERRPVIIDPTTEPSKFH